MNADIETLYLTGFYRVIDFKCKCREACISRTEYSKSFNISFIRKGNFIYKVFRNDFDAYTGFAIIDKPGIEHVVAHCHHIPDECTIIDFSDEFYQAIRDSYNVEYKSFFSNQDVPSLFVNTDNTIEYLHFLLLKQILRKNPDRLYVDCLVMEILQWFLDKVDNNNFRKGISSRLKRQHLQTFEKAKDYIFNNFFENITLNDIASHCNVSPYHFSRIFKQISDCSPYRFLRDTRLANAKQLVEHTNLPIREVSFLSGFQNVENFNAAFREKYLNAPSCFRKSKNS
jgi:AraC-like DNA-binding protein